MRSRTALATTLVGLLVAGAASPSLAATKKKPKPIRGSYTAQAAPDPTNDIVGAVCDGVENKAANVSRFDKTFAVPAAGTLHVETLNTLDWAIALIDTDGSIIESSDGGSPQDKESVDVPFKRKQKVVLRTCNFAGEPQVTVNYVFTYK
jgi:hypothetical protein